MIIKLLEIEIIQILLAIICQMGLLAFIQVPHLTAQVANYECWTNWEQRFITITLSFTGILCSITFLIVNIINDPVHWVTIIIGFFSIIFILIHLFYAVACIRYMIKKRRGE